MGFDEKDSKCYIHHGSMAHTVNFDYCIESNFGLGSTKPILTKINNRTCCRQSTALRTNKPCYFIVFS